MFCITLQLNAQGVSINATGLPPDSSAELDVSAMSKGFLMPRVTAAQRDAISNPATGLFIYNTDCNVLNYNAGTPTSPNWVTVTTSNALVANVTISASPVGAICANTSVTFTAVPSNGINSPTYQWKLNGTDVGTNSSTYTNSALNTGDVVNCILTSTEPCVTGSPATSNPITMTVNPLPTTPGPITGSSTVCANSTGNVYSISPIAGASTYIWSVPSGASITGGAGTNSITINMGTDTGTISVAEVNGCGTSSASTLSITVTGGHGSQTFSYTGSSQIFTVPACATQVFVKMWGAGGGGASWYAMGGSGAFVSGYLNTTPGANLTVIVGGGGGGGCYQCSGASGAGGFGGGGNSGTDYPNTDTRGAGGGGGRTAIQITPGTDAATAGGGGGGGSIGQYVTSPYGGGGGAPNGADGGSSVVANGAGSGSGHGGTTSAGGAGSTGGTTNTSDASSQTGSAGGADPNGGGGGGGGYYGGSGGSGNSDSNAAIGGGGGGSSYTANLTSVSNIAGLYGGDQGGNWAAPNNGDINYLTGVGIGGGNWTNGGNGLVVISW